MRPFRRLAGLVAVLLVLGAWHYPCRVVLDEPRYVALVERLRGEGFDDDRTTVLRETAQLSSMTCAQFVSLMPYFQWRAGKLGALEVAVQAIVDPQNADLIIDAFPSADRSRAREILRR